MKTSHLQRWVGLVLTLIVLLPTIAGAQAPWTVTVKPSMNPLPIGFCAAVDLTVLDRNGERPRNPAGYLMGPADFDLSVTSRNPRAVAGDQTDPHNWKACGCQAGLAGEVATITASYPADRLPEERRERGVSFKTTTTFTLAAAKGPSESLACREPMPAPSQASRERRPPPAGVTVTGTPALARVAWKSVGASSYSVQRWMKNDPACCRASSPQLGATATTWEDPLPLAGTDAVDRRASQRQQYVYRVTATYADGRQGFVDVNFVRPEPTNPAWFTAKKKQVKLYAYIGYYWFPYWHVTVTLEWAEVPGASYYAVHGPGLPLTATHYYTSAHEFVLEDSPGHAPVNISPFPPWTVAAVFLPGPVTTAAAEFTKVSLTWDLK